MRNGSAKPDSSNNTYSHVMEHALPFSMSPESVDSPERALVISRNGRRSSRPPYATKWVAYTTAPRRRMASELTTRASLDSGANIMAPYTGITATVATSKTSSGARTGAGAPRTAPRDGVRTKRATNSPRSKRDVLMAVDPPDVPRSIAGWVMGEFVQCESKFLPFKRCKILQKTNSFQLKLSCLVLRKNQHGKTCCSGGFG